MKDQPARNIEEKIAATPGRVAFRPIQDFLTEEKVEVKPPRVLKEQVDAWLKEHPGSVSQASINIYMGFPERALFPVPILARASQGEHVLVLNVDGTTHRFHEEECEK